jgi:hypothetical protein
MTNCEICTGKRWYAKLGKNGTQLVNSDGLRLWRCYRCGNIQVESAIPFIPQNIRRGASILYIDLEVSYSLTYSYGLKVPSKYISPENLQKSYFIIAWSASYVGESKIYHDIVTPEDAKLWSDAKILPRLYELMLSADIIAGHNVDGYDIKRANTRFVMNNMDAVTGKKTLDTLKIARSKFAFESNKLDYICEVLGLDGKDHISSEEWKKVMQGDEAVLRHVSRYNIRDVRQGKKVLARLQSYAGKSKTYGTVVLD